MTGRLRIGIDGRILGARPKGMARYIWELCKGLDATLPQAEFYLYSREPIGVPRISDRWHERVETGLARRLPKSIWAVTRPGFLARRDCIDVFWGGAGLIPLVGLSARSVLSVHDLVHMVMPETMSREARLVMKAFFEPCVSRSDAIVTNSAGTASRLRAAMGYAASAIVRPAVSGSFTLQPQGKITSVLERFGLRRPYLLGVATWEPRKGLELLVRAFSRLQSEGQLSAYTLALAGDRGWRDHSLAELVGRCGERVAPLGFVDDDELAALYSGCDLFVYPSKYEGFGMPVLEARACGARVVTTDSPELREAGDDDAIYVPPNEEGVRQGILTALQLEKRHTMGTLDRCQRSWAASAATLARVLAGESHPESLPESLHA